MVVARAEALRPDTAPKAQGNGRDAWLDNAKMVLVTIVVVGHMVVLVPDGDEQSRVYDFIYYFHIPAFVLLTGYVSKSFRYDMHHLWALFTTMVVPYFLFSWLMVQFRHQEGGELMLDPIWTDPRWPMWYLAATVIWRLLTPLLRLHPVMVPLSVAVSLLGGLTDQELFDVNRTMGFLPFFVIGLHLSAERLAVVRRPRAWVAGVLGLLLLWWFAPRTDDYWATEFLYFRAPYAELGVGDLEGIWIRARLIAIALLAVAAVLTLVPHRRSFVTRMGVWSLVVYLCHGFVVRYLEYRDYEDWMPGAGWWSVAITVAVGVALSLVIAWEPVARTLDHLVDPVNSFVRWFPQRDGTASRARRPAAPGSRASRRTPASRSCR